MHVVTPWPRPIPVARGGGVGTGDFAVAGVPAGTLTPPANFTNNTERSTIAANDYDLVLEDVGLLTGVGAFAEWFGTVPLLFSGNTLQGPGPGVWSAAFRSSDSVVMPPENPFSTMAVVPGTVLVMDPVDLAINRWTSGLPAPPTGVAGFLLSETAPRSRPLVAITPRLGRAAATTVDIVAVSHVATRTSTPTVGLDLPSARLWREIPGGGGPVDVTATVLASTTPILVRSGTGQNAPIVEARWRLSMVESAPGLGDGVIPAGLGNDVPVMISFQIRDEVTSGTPGVLVGRNDVVL